MGVEVNSAGQLYFDELKNQHFDISFQTIKTTQSSKQRMVNRLTLTLEQENLIFPEKRQILQEFLSFRQKGNKLEAIEGQHDDIVMSLCFAL